MMAILMVVVLKVRRMIFFALIFWVFEEEKEEWTVKGSIAAGAKENVFSKTLSREYIRSCNISKIAYSL